MLTKVEKFTYEEFLDLDNKTEEQLELIDGVIYNQSSPSTIHLSISVNLTAEFRNYFRSRGCEIFHAPFDVKLKNDNEEFQN